MWDAGVLKEIGAREGNDEDGGKIGYLDFRSIFISCNRIEVKGNAPARPNVPAQVEGSEQLLAGGQRYRRPG